MTENRVAPLPGARGDNGDGLRGSANGRGPPAVSAQRDGQSGVSAEADALGKLNELSSRLWRMRRLSEGLDEMLAATIELLGADMGNVQLLDNDRPVLLIAAQRGFEKEFLSFFREVSTEDESACGRALRSGERIVIEDVETDEPFAPLRPIARNAGYRSVQSTPLIARDGRPLGMLSTHWRVPHIPGSHELRRLDLYARQATDFIERCRTDEALRLSEERLHLAQSIARIGTFEWNIESGVTLWTPELEAMYGLKPGEFPRTQDAWEDLVHPEDLTAVLARVEEALQTGRPAEHEWRVVWPDRSVHWVAGRFQCLKDAQGRPLLLSGVNIDITDRKRAEEALRASAERLRGLTETAVDGIITIDERGVIEMLNPAAVKLFGYELHEVIGRNVRMLMPEPYRSEHDGYLENYLRTGEKKIIGIGREVTGLRADGSTFPMELSVSETRLADGRSSFAGIVRDITDRKHAEEALRESEERFARFMQQLPGLAWIKDVDGRYVYANEGAEKAFQTPREKLYGKTDEEVFPPAVAAQFAENDRQALASEAGVLVVETLEHDDGVLHHSIVSKFPIPGPGGQPVLIGGVSIDITERKQAEEALRESEERFRNMANSAPMMICVTEPDASCSFVSKSWLEFTGRELEEALGFGWLEAVHRDDQNDLDETALARADRRGPIHAEYRLRRHDGEYRWILDAAAPRFGRGGEFLGWIHSITDITERREFEEELRRANAAKDEFLGLVSHELRTPITTILGNSLVLRERSSSLSADERAASLDDISSDAQRLDRIVQNLLVLARLERGQEVELEPLLLARILSRLVEDVRRRSRRTITLDVVGQVGTVLAHPDYVEQVVRNLLSNAEKYSPPSEPIEVALSQKGHLVAVSVSDRGDGIPESEREEIFAPFFRSQSTQRLQGIGIGLAVCRRLAEAMGGRIWVDGRRGGGSTFEFTLPVYVEA